MAVNDRGIFNKAKVATGTYKNAAANEEMGLDEADNEIDKYSVTTGKGTTLQSSSFPKISVSGLKYADLDGDGTADGIIVADISTEATTYKGGNPLGDSNGSFSYTKVSSGLREYLENSSYKYTNADGSEVEGTLIKYTNNTGTPKYYIISLADYDSNGHYWYQHAYNKMSDYSKFTSVDFGKGKKNTENMINAWNNVKYGEPSSEYDPDMDMWGIIQDKAKEGWFVPSRAEWTAFASYLNTSTKSTDLNYYKKYGLSDFYWSSSQYNEKYAWRLGFIDRYMRYGDVNNGGYSLRLCATF